LICILSFLEKKKKKVDISSLLKEGRQKKKIPRHLSLFIWEKERDFLSPRSRGQSRRIKATSFVGGRKCFYYPGGESDRRSALTGSSPWEGGAEGG